MSILMGQKLSSLVDKLHFTDHAYIYRQTEEAKRQLVEITPLLCLNPGTFTAHTPVNEDRIKDLDFTFYIKAWSEPRRIKAFLQKPVLKKHVIIWTTSFWETLALATWRRQIHKQMILKSKREKKEALKKLYYLKRNPTLLQEEVRKFKEWYGLKEELEIAEIENRLQSNVIIFDKKGYIKRRSTRDYDSHVILFQAEGQWGYVGPENVYKLTRSRLRK